MAGKAEKATASTGIVEIVEIVAIEGTRTTKAGTAQGPFELPPRREARPAQLRAADEARARAQGPAGDRDRLPKHREVPELGRGAQGAGHTQVVGRRLRAHLSLWAIRPRPASTPDR